MKARPTVSVIMPTRNRVAFLRQAAGSVLAQSLGREELELWVVDDASEDGTWEWLRSQNEPILYRLRMERQRERSAARNAALREARGEFVLFLDDDDRLFPGALAAMLQALRRKQSAIAAVGAAAYSTPWGTWRRIPHYPRPRVRSAWREALFAWSPIFGQVLIGRSAVAEAGGWNERLSLAEDFELWLRLARLGPVAFIPDTVLAYRIHPGRTSRTGVESQTVALRRAAVRALEPRERTVAERSIRAQRHSRKALAEYLRERYPSACLHYWLAIRRAPWLLASPLCRGNLAGKFPQALTKAILGDRGYRVLRRTKHLVLKAIGRAPERSRKDVPGPELGPHDPR